MKGQLRIEQMYAFVAVDVDGTEGIPAFADPRTGLAMPMVGADMKRIESLRPMAQELATQGGLTITLCRFEVRTEIEEFLP